MIAPLRRRHRALVIALALLLPAPVVLSLTERDGFPVRTPVDLLEAARGFDRVLIFEDEPAPLAVRLGPGDALRGTADQTFLRVEQLAPATAPELLFYASSSPAEEGAGVPADARLLGTLEVVDRPLAIDASHLIVYSLGHARVVRSIALD